MDGRRSQHTNSEWLGKCLEGFDFPLPCAGLSCFGSSPLHPQPLCVPQGHRADSSWPLAEWVALCAEIHCQNWHLDLPGASWLLPGMYCSCASLPCWEAACCCASKIGVVGCAFHPVRAFWINGADICVCACSLLPLLHPILCCNDCGI